MIAASIAPLLAMVGGGVDMGRSYMAQARLQQACDAGVLAARKRLGSEAVVTGTIPEDAGLIGQRFFNVNYRAGAYGSVDRSFVMTLEDDYAISGVAQVTVPTSIMRIFGFNEVPIKVDCEAQINFSNTDVMMVLDVTGSMNETNPGDSASRLETLRGTVKSFYAQLAAAATAGTRIRYGFVPYSTNVNVGGLLEDDWVVDEWTYQSRVLESSTLGIVDWTYYTASSPVSGTRNTVEYSTYAASFDELDGFYCPTKPASSLSTSSTIKSTTTEVFIGPPAGAKVTQVIERTRNGKTYSVSLKDTTCVVTETTYTSYVDTYDKVTQPRFDESVSWLYRPVTIDVTNWRAETEGCMEERDTYKIDDYDNVDLTRALDLDIDLTPTGDPRTRWRPMYPGMIYGRAVEWSGAGSFVQHDVKTSKEFIAPQGLRTDACPAPSLRMQQLTSEELDDYLASLRAEGSTYHDIGMIWGGRLISPSGIFADENADVGPTQPTNRNLIFLTDGVTATLDLSYSSYGFEPVDQRRWDSAWKVKGQPVSLTSVVENRFAFACNEVRKRNITVWIVGFGTGLSQMMKDCAGEGHYFEAADAAELNATFATIAKNLSQLRIQR
ncbi:hypothetical protein A6F68_02186 [Tsuneonella dongtanensis]|uniref:VWFA domain-containing protein n=2 Tax=Tsuneonella dongtanensis TaxID=692370 RepID=A0A1B2AEV0_9SPHN|nr:hypothetical protein A6F68_02186 [Tsuneonella dongtanensis]